MCVSDFYEYEWHEWYFNGLLLHFSTLWTLRPYGLGSETLNLKLESLIIFLMLSSAVSIASKLLFVSVLSLPF